jgi:hypothetical protein
MIVCVIPPGEMHEFTSEHGFYRMLIEKTLAEGGSVGMICLGSEMDFAPARKIVGEYEGRCKAVFLPLPNTDLMLRVTMRVAVKMLLNALSTCVMVRLGRVQGNCMTAVVPSNLKLIDRSTRYVQVLTGLSYEDACRSLFGSIEYIKPRMSAGQAYPPPVELTVQCIKQNCSPQEAESRMLPGRQ